MKFIASVEPFKCHKSIGRLAIKPKNEQKRFYVQPTSLNQERTLLHLIRQLAIKNIPTKTKNST